MSRQFGENLDDWVNKPQKKTEEPVPNVDRVLFKESQRLLDESRPNEALTVINVAIENNDSNFEYFKLKARILDSLNRYSEASSAYDSALKLNKSDELIKSKSEMLYRWANSLNDKNRALEIITEAIEIAGIEPEDANWERFSAGRPSQGYAI